MEFAEKIDFIMKSINETNRLNYFKNELLKILDARERQENKLSKAIEDYFDEIEKSVYGWGIEKGKLGTVGEIRTWKDGKRYKKMPDGKWVRVYQSMSRSAEISIARLKGIVGNAQSVEELYKICMANNRSFATEDGYLPILQELSNEAEKRQAQIEDTVTRIKPLFEPRINDSGIVKENAKEKKLSNIELKRMLKQFYKEKLQGGYVKNLSTGKKIILSRDGLDEWECKSKSREQILSLKCLDFFAEKWKVRPFGSGSKK